MNDVLLHYLEVNFAEIADQLAHARAAEPDREDRAAAAERLRGLIRRLRRDAEESGVGRKEPRATAADVLASLDGELSPDERAVLDHFFDLFARSMQRTQAAIPPPVTEPEATTPARPETAQPEPLEVVVAEPPPVVPATEPEPEASPSLEAEPEAAPTAEAEPEAPAVPQVEPELAGIPQAEREVAPASEAEPEAAPAAQAEPEAAPAAQAEPEAAPAAQTEPEPLVPPEPPPVVETPPAARFVSEQMSGPMQTILLAAAQQALDLLQVDASQVYTIGDQRRFVLRAGVPTESLAAPEGNAPITSTLLRRALDSNEVYSIEDLAAEELTPDEAAWVDAGYRGFAAIALSPPLERPVGVLVLLRRTPWRLDRRDAVRLEDLAAEAVAALRSHSLAIKIEEVAILQERLNLAREIHDGLASDLAAVVALFKYYEQRRERDPDDAAQLLPQIRGMTEEILTGARNILQSLRPKTIRSEGLLASVLKAVDQFGRVNLIETSVSIRGEETVLSAEQKEVIFQVLREGLSNIRKHSQARNVWVLLDLSTGPWVMTVRDDGRGFDVRRVAEDPRKVGSYGLVGMRERAELMGGTLEIVSQVMDGTIVTLIGPPERPE